MDCGIEEREGVAIVSPRGDLDAENVASFQTEIDKLLGDGVHYYVIDLGDVSFLDSSGLAAIVRLYKRVRIGEGDVRLARVPPSVMTVLELTRLSKVFDIFATAAEATASIKHQD